MARNLKNITFVVNKSLRVPFSQILKLSRRPPSCFNLTSSSSLHLIKLWVSRWITESCLNQNNTLMHSSEKRKKTKTNCICTLEMLSWYITMSHSGAAAVLVDHNAVLSVLDGQTSFPQDERGQFLWAVHGGAGHSARQTSVRDGHHWICQTTQKVGLVRFPFKGHHIQGCNLAEAFHEILLFTGQRWGSFGQRICLKHG